MIPNNQWVHKKNMICTYCGILFSHKKWNDVEWDKKNPKSQISYVLTHLWRLDLKWWFFDNNNNETTWM
jgi:hypothetical protein